MTKHVSTQAGYDLWAGNYDTNGNPLVALDDAELARFLNDDLNGIKAVDIGCGTGRATALLALRGASVTGLDFSRGMLDIARGKLDRMPLPHPVTLLEHDVQQPLPFPDATFDLVTSCLVLEHIADLPRFFAEIARVARPNACIYVSAMHPTLLLKGVQANFTDPSSGDEIRPHGYPHTLADFINAILTTDLGLRALHEDLPDSAFVAHFPKAEKYLGWPMLAVFELTAKA